MKKWIKHGSGDLRHAVGSFNLPLIYTEYSREKLRAAIYLLYPTVKKQYNCKTQMELFIVKLKKTPSSYLKNKDIVLVFDIEAKDFKAFRFDQDQKEWLSASIDTQKELSNIENQDKIEFEELSEYLNSSLIKLKMKIKTQNLVDIEYN